MQFIPYQKIRTSTAKMDIKINKTEKWVVLEKINGANFSIYCDGTETKFAKRTAFLTPNEWFYSYEQVAQNLAKKIVNLYRHIKLEQPDMHHIILYGELFGGFYPPNPDSWTGAMDAQRINDKNECIIAQRDRAVQEGIYYSPTVEFCAFDLCVKRTAYAFTDYTDVLMYCQLFGILCVPPLMMGSFQDALKFDYNRDSQIGTLCGQPPLPNNSNICEGIVIKPVNSSLVTAAGQRPMIKLKNKAFAEISGDFNTPAAQSMVTVNRLTALQSKIGSFDSLTEDQIVSLFMEDIMTDYYETGSNEKFDYKLAQQESKKLISLYLKRQN